MAIVNQGDSQQFDYTGGVQSFIVPQDGLYMLEVYGGGGTTKQGKGGYSVGYKQLKKGTELFICCGGQGSYGMNPNNARAGYNGGGTAHKPGDSSGNYYAGGGGGATHIALQTGVLSSLSEAKEKVLIVAGGGGGGELASSSSTTNGGAGGGTSGGNGGSYSSGAAVSGGSGGTQTTAGKAGNGSGKQTIGGFGYGGKGLYGGGGGGGWYGGGGGYGYAGGGGSGYIGGVPKITFKGKDYEPQTISGQRVGNGYALITFVAKGFPTVLWNGIVLEGARHDIVNAQGQVISSTEIDAITFDGKPIE